MRSLFIIFVLFCELLSLEIIYEPRIPYIVENDKSIEGFVATPLINALQSSDIQYTLKSKPSKRHLSEIASNKTPICAVGWFKNSNREKFAKFSKALYQDKPVGILTHKLTHIQENSDIEKIVQENKFKVLIKDSYSYGDFLDSLIKDMVIKKTDAKNYNMVTMIAKRRADMMFISYEEAMHYLEEHKYKSRIKFIPLSGMPEGNKRYLICSKNVDDKTIEKINRNIQ